MNMARFENLQHDMRENRAQVLLCFVMEQIAQ